MSQREHCHHCCRPLQTCLCKHVERVANAVKLIILQHPLEVNESKNSGRLLQLCLINSHLYVGEQFSDDFFAEHQQSNSYDLLLYPETPEEKSLGILHPPALDFSRITTGDKLSNLNTMRLWVLDATWRKSRKMLYVNRTLQAMPRISLTDCPPSLYDIRKAQGEHQLSTLEASCYALRQLEQNQVDYTPVLTAFRGFIAEHKSYRPNDHTLDPL